MRTCPVIVIGHIDHGKTSLVRALTGIDTDTLPEETSRGVSIALGFAHRQIGERTFDFIDAPGHEKFINTMVSGASGAQAALLVVSAVEGVQAQTREHIEIVTQLGVVTGIVAVTKADLLSKSAQQDAVEKIQAGLAQSVFACAPIIACSAVTGQGLEEIVAALEQLGPLKQDAPREVFLPVDRVFTSAGQGTIVTGTLRGAPLRPDMSLTLTSNLASVTIRGIQTRGQPTGIAYPGERTAVNLRGVAADTINRGDILHTTGAFTASTQIDVELSLASSLKHMEKVRVLHGAAHIVVSIRLYAKRLAAANAVCLAQLRFEKPVTTYAGQRLLLRRLSPAETVGGAIVIDPVAAPTKSSNTDRIKTLVAARQGDLRDIAAALAEEHGGVANIDALARLARVSADDVRGQLTEALIAISETGIAPDTVIDRSTENYLAHLQSYHDTHPLRPAAPRTHMASLKLHPELTTYVESALTKEGILTVTATHLSLCAHEPFALLTPAQTHRMQALKQVFRDAGLRPPASVAVTLNAEDEDLLLLLIHAGDLTRLHNVSLNQSLVFESDSLMHGHAALRKVFPPPAAFTTGEARAALSTTRKYVVPILEHFDEKGLTRRSDNTRQIVIAPAT